MKYKLLFLIWLMWVLAILPGYAQQPTSEVDSLQKAFASAIVDSVKIELRYWLGIKTPIQRVAYWDSLIADATECHALRFKGKAFNTLGFYTKQAGLEEKAMGYFIQSYQIAKDVGNKSDQIPPLYNFSCYYYVKNDIKRSLDYCFKGLKIAEEIKDQQKTAMLYAQAGLCYYASGEISKALEVHLKCLEVYRSLAYNKGIAEMLMSVGTDYEGLHEKELANKYYMECKSYINEFGDGIHSVQLHNSIGSAYISLRQYDSAYKYCTMSYEVAKKIDNTRAIVSAMASLVDIHNKRGETQKAVVMGEKAMELLRTIDFKIQVAPLAILLSDVYKNAGDYKKSLAYFELYISSRDSLSDEQTRKDLAEKEFAYNFEKKENENKLLAQQNQIQTLQLSRDKTLFFSLGALFLTLLIIGYLLFRQNKLKAAHQRIRLEQKLLRSQMNPHFIFNCLSSIQQFIVSGKNDQAEWYLVRFSKLIREFLETNLKESISIKEEVDILTVYLEMESLRFDESFSYSIQVDERIDAAITQIPLLMLQPFVENAIWHGLLPKADNRKLQVFFEYDTAKTIRCTIDDNGVGREMSGMKIQPVKKQSLALQFVQERIDLLREKLKISGKVEIIDKTDANGGSLGTTVVIVLPVL